MNIPDRQIEVYTSPPGSPDYVTWQTYHPGDNVPLVLDGAAIGTVSAAEMLP